jgi:hypothetical protein
MSRARYYDDDDDDDDNGLDWHELDTIYDTSVSINKLADLDGGLLHSDMKIDEKDLEKNLIPGGDPFEGVNDRNEDYEGFMGNSVRPSRQVLICFSADTNTLQGPTATHFYRTSVSCFLVMHEMLIAGY